MNLALKPLFFVNTVAIPAQCVVCVSLDGCDVFVAPVIDKACMCYAFHRREPNPENVAFAGRLKYLVRTVDHKLRPEKVWAIGAFRIYHPGLTVTPANKCGTPRISFPESGIFEILLYFWSVVFTGKFPDTNLGVVNLCYLIRYITLLSKASNRKSERYNTNDKNTFCHFSRLFKS